ncbi:MAG TPA: triose-phosphate isomerase, partial [Aggregatilineales bacterium]|nr:triose-phosphate isomerase [Aggregatilineales bacterium]
VCPPFVALPAVHDVLKGTPIKVGAQDVHYETQGAFTSEVSAPMLVGLVEYVIIGHSEVRQYLAETDERVNKKAVTALAYNLKPIIAVGESLATNEAGKTVEFVGAQVRAAFKNIPADALTNIVVAYEPIWAIGTGRSASAEQANRIIKTAIRDVLAELYNRDQAEGIRIQYGGSVKPDNMAEFMSQPDIDGALVGGASLKVDDFVKLVQAAIAAKKGC